MIQVGCGCCAARCTRCRDVHLYHLVPSPVLAKGHGHCRHHKPGLHAVLPFPLRWCTLPLHVALAAAAVAGEVWCLLLSLDPLKLRCKSRTSCARCEQCSQHQAASTAAAVAHPVLSLFSFLCCWTNTLSLLCDACMQSALASQRLLHPAPSSVPQQVQGASAQPPATQGSLGLQHQLPGAKQTQPGLILRDAVLVSDVLYSCEAAQRVKADSSMWLCVCCSVVLHCKVCRQTAVRSA